MAAKKKAAPEAPKATAASRAKDAEEQPDTFRVDLGESIPTPKIPTATDNE